jgi:hypothetical protein
VPSTTEITHAQIAAWLEVPPPVGGWTLPVTRTARQQLSRDWMVQVLWWRFFDQEPRSRRWIAEQINRSPARVQQIEAKGLRMLRHPRRRAAFDGYAVLAGTPFYDAVFNW